MQTLQENPEQLRHGAHALTGDISDWDYLIEKMGDKRIVMLGEASHGTHEFYQMRMQVTQRLIAEKGFHAIMIEGDWPDAWRVNAYLRGMGDDRDAEQALGGFKRFPQWMWRNAEILELVSWLKEYNDSLNSPIDQIGFYGLDLYSLYSSIGALIAYLEQEDPQAATLARERYACFEEHTPEAQRYGHAVSLGTTPGCRRAAVRQLVEMRRQGAAGAGDDFLRMQEIINGEENARSVVDAEQYYRGMFQDPEDSWNLRERHMADSLDYQLAHLDRWYDDGTKVIVWAHNSHVGDARATQWGTDGRLTLGRMMRERHGDDCGLVGFSTWAGTVAAAQDWDQDVQLMNVNEALDDSMENLLHGVGLPAFYVDCDQQGLLDRAMLQRAIGVIYRPQTELQSHYLRAIPARQFDLIVHADRTRAVEPLESVAGWPKREAPETYPAGV